MLFSFVIALSTEFRPFSRLFKKTRDGANEPQRPVKHREIFIAREKSGALTIVNFERVIYASVQKILS